MSEQYDSQKETQAHRYRVCVLLTHFIREFVICANNHDESKTGDIEKPIFDKMTPLLKGSTYGSDEYKAMLAEMTPALDHHYASNRHHPEHFENGVDGMNLVDLIEMLCDWKAAGERHANGNIEASIKHNTTRFNLSPQLVSILNNTVRDFDFIKPVKQ